MKSILFVTFALSVAANEPSLATVPAKCMQPKFVGWCRASMSRFFYNSDTGRCENFFYGGCDGNENNFFTRDQCAAECEGATSTVALMGANSALSDVCRRPAKTGQCMTYMPGFYYDPAMETCKQFAYGECQSNGNSFRTEVECVSRCKPGKRKTSG
jgi:Kunitz/Bovine pancreatic trypsin inhibitor domain